MKQLLFLTVMLATSMAFADSTFSSVRAKLKYSYTELDAPGYPARLNSEFSPGISLSLAEHWDNKNTSSIEFGYSKLKFKQPEGALVESMDQSLISFGVRHTYTFKENLRSSVGLFGEEQFYLRKTFKPSPAAQLTLDKYLNAVLKVDTEYDFFSRKNIDLGLAVNLDVTPPFTAERYEGEPGNYEVSTAYGYGGSIYGRRYLKNFSLEGAIYYHAQVGQTTYGKQTTTDQGITLRVGIPFGK